MLIVCCLHTFWQANLVELNKHLDVHLSFKLVCVCNYAFVAVLMAGAVQLKHSICLMQACMWQVSSEDAATKCDKVDVYKAVSKCVLSYGNMRNTWKPFEPSYPHTGSHQCASTGPRHDCKINRHKYWCASDLLHTVQVWDRPPLAATGL